MQIIQKGKIPDEIEHQAQCKNCKTIFVFKNTEGDIRYGYDNRDGNYIKVDCPLCKKPVYKAVP